MRKFLFTLFLPLFSLQGQTPQEDAKIPDFWSTGPLLGPAGDIVEYGHIALQPYVYWFQYTGTYGGDWRVTYYENTFNTLLFQPYFRVGLYKSIAEIDIYPQVYYNYTKGASNWAFGDMPIWINAMLWGGEGHSYSMMLQFSLNVPFGKYRKFDPLKLATDDVGVGSWFPGAGLILYKDWHIWEAHYIALTYYANYSFGTSMNVEGLNAYGGDVDTVGRVSAGNQFLTILSSEFSLSHNWLLCLDAQYLHQNTSKFSGTTTTTVGGYSLEQFSIAPSIEILWAENMGLIFGSWFPFAGRKTDQFNNFTVSLYMYW